MEGKTPAFILRLALAGFLGGIVIGHLVNWPVYILGGLLILAAVGLIFNKKYQLWLVVIIMAILGWWRAETSLPIKPLNLPIGTRVSFVGFISEAPLLAEDSARYIIQTNDVSWQNVLVKTRRYPILSYGQEIKVVCKLEDLPSDYWNNKNIFSTCSYPGIEVLSESGGIPFKKFLLNTRTYLSSQLANFIPEPETSLLSGILWGERVSIPNDLKEDFRRAGVSHILAVSGYNVTTISVIFLSILIALGLSRRPASALSLVLIFLFVFFSGAEAAVLRAGVMGSLVVGARLLGRLARPLNLLLLAAAVILLGSPRLLTDLGFQLSFLAMSGLMYLSPIFYEKFTIVPNFLNLRQIIAETMAASLTTIPWLILKTDYVSLVSPIANLLIVPVIPLVMIGGLLLLPVAIIFPALALVSYPVWLVLRYIEVAVKSLSQLPLSYLAVNWLGLLLLSVIYLLVFRWIIKIKQKPI